MALQNAQMQSKGIGWKAEACRDPRACEEGLCVRDRNGNAWHPADPLAFAKWRVRARLADIPAHVLVAQMGGESLFGRVLVWGAGLLTTAFILAVWIGRHERAERPCSI